MQYSHRCHMAAAPSKSVLFLEKINDGTYVRPNFGGQLLLLYDEHWAHNASTIIITNKQVARPREGLFVRSMRIQLWTRGNGHRAYHLQRMKRCDSYCDKYTLRIHIRQSKINLKINQKKTVQNATQNRRHYSRLMRPKICQRTSMRCWQSFSFLLNPVSHKTKNRI